MRWAEFDTEDTVGNRLDKPLSFLQRADLDWGSRCGGSVVMDVAQDDLVAVVTRPGPPCSPCWGSPGQPAVFPPAVILSTEDIATWEQRSSWLSWKVEEWQ